MGPSSLESMTSQPTLPGIFMTFSKLCVWGRTDGHGSRGSCPSAQAPAPAQLRAQEGCRYPTCALPAMPPVSLDLQTQQSSRAPGRSGEAALVSITLHVAHPPPSPGAWPGFSPMLGAELGAQGHKEGTNQASGFFDSQ